jgi:hypothetical protein
MKSRIALAGIFCLVSGILFAQKMTVKDSDSNVLMEVNDEGAVGSITVPSGSAPSTVTDKLYNVGGKLFWSGNALGFAGSAGGWTNEGGVVHTVSSTDKVGIGTLTPELNLSIQSGGIIAGGTFGDDTTLATTGGGTRLIWYPKKAAFRAGHVVTEQWDDFKIGDYSAALGNNTVAGGSASTAFGYDNNANGDYSLATGASTLAVGNYALSAGYSTRADAYMSAVFGRYNVGGGDGFAWDDADPLFEIGNGDGSLRKANALTVLKNGNVGIGDPAPDYLLEMEASGGGYYSMADHDWHMGSSREIKQDIEPNDIDVQAVLDDVHIVKYRYKTEAAEDPGAPYHVGFIAEDTPEMLTGKDRNSMSTGHCIGLLLAVVKEQQKEIEKLKTEMQELKR